MLKKTLILTTALAFGLSIPAMAQPTAAIAGKSQQTIVAKKVADDGSAPAPAAKKHKKKKKKASS